MKKIFILCFALIALVFSMTATSCISCGGDVDKSCGYIDGFYVGTYASLDETDSLGKHPMRQVMIDFNGGDGMVRLIDKGSHPEDCGVIECVYSVNLKDSVVQWIYTDVIDGEIKGDSYMEFRYKFRKCIDGEGRNILFLKDMDDNDMQMRLTEMDGRNFNVEWDKVLSINKI